MKLFSLRNHRTKIATVLLSSILALSIIACSDGGSGGGSESGGSGNESGGSGSSSGGTGSGGTSGSTVPLTNTTWLFIEFNSDSQTCSGPHGTGTPAEEPAPSGPGAGCTDSQVLSTTKTDKQETVNQQREGFYLHVDSNDIAYFGKVSFSETGTKYYVEKRTGSKYVCSQHIAAHEREVDAQPLISQENIRYDTTKSGYVFSPLAKGKCTMNNGKLNFDFPYGLAESAGEKFFAYGLTPNGDDSLKTCKLLKSNNTSYNNVAKISGSELKITYDTSSTQCPLYKNSINDEKCLRKLTTTYYTKWEKLPYDESLKGPKHDPDSVLSKLQENELFFIDGNSEPEFNEDYEYISFVDNMNYESKSATYKGMDYFYSDYSSDTVRKHWSHLKNAQDKDAIILSEGSGTSWTHNLFYLGNDGILYKDANNSNAGYKPSVGKFSSYISEILINRNEYQHKKEYAVKDFPIQWYEQNAEWVDSSNGEFLKYSGSSKYDAKFGGTTYTFTEFGDLNNQKCLLIDTASKKSFVLTDKGRSVEITDADENVKTLSYSKRAGYEDSNYVEVTFKTNRDANYKSIKESFLNYDTVEENNTFKVKLLKTTAIKDLTSGDYPKIGKTPHGYVLKVRSVSESGAEIAETATVESNKNLFIDVRPEASAFFVTYKLSSKLSQTYRLYSIEGFDNNIDIEGTENKILVLPSDKISDTYRISEKIYPFTPIEYKFMNGETEVSKDNTFSDSSISSACTIDIVPTIDIVDYSIKFVPEGLTFNGSSSPVNVNRTSNNKIGGDDPSKDLLNMVGAGQDYYWVYDNKVIYCSNPDVWDCGITADSKLAELGLAEGSNTITVKPIPMGPFKLPEEFKTDRISISITGLTSGTLVVDATTSTTVQAFTYMIMGSAQTDMTAYMKLMSGFKLKKDGTAVMTINMMDQNPDTSKLSECGITENVTLSYEALQ